LQTTALPPPSPRLIDSCPPIALARKRIREGERTHYEDRCKYDDQTSSDGSDAVRY
jgi:hypothetical protein